MRLSRLKIQLQESHVILLFEGFSSRSNAIKKSFCGPTKVKFRTDVALFQDLNFSCEKVITFVLGGLKLVLPLMLSIKRDRKTFCGPRKIKFRNFESIPDKL